MPLSKYVLTIPAPSIVAHITHHFIPPYVHSSSLLSIYLSTALRTYLKVNTSIVQIHIFLTSQIWMDFFRTDKANRFVAYWTPNFFLWEVWGNCNTFTIVVGTPSGQGITSFKKRFFFNVHFLFKNNWVIMENYLHLLFRWSWNTSFDITSILIQLLCHYILLKGIFNAIHAKHVTTRPKSKRCKTVLASHMFILTKRTNVILLRKWCL